MPGPARHDPSGDPFRHLGEEALSASWLASRLGIMPERLDALRRSGKLLAVRPPGSTEHLYPLWQFDDDGRPLEGVGRVLEAARAAGLDERGLYELLARRIGLVDQRRLADVMREGGWDQVIAAIRAARPSKRA